MDLSIIVPCYNESDNIPLLKTALLPVVLKICRSAPYPQCEIIFVDDGSRDGSMEALLGAFQTSPHPGLQFILAQHPRNLGLGAAMRTGFSIAAGDIVVTVDSDGSYGFETIPALLACLTSAIDIVTASPYHPDGNVEGVPFYRLVLSQGSSFLYRILVEWRIHTYTSLFRAYRSEVIRTIDFKSDGFLAGTELLVNALHHGYRVGEYPAVLKKRAYGVSKAKIFQTIRAHLAFQWELLLYKFHLIRQIETRGV